MRKIEKLILGMVFIICVVLVGYLIINLSTPVQGAGTSDQGYLIYPGDSLTLNTIGQITGFRVISVPPATSTSPGVAGQITWDVNYIYICTSTNVWKRVPLASW